MKAVLRRISPQSPTDDFHTCAGAKTKATQAGRKRVVAGNSPDSGRCTDLNGVEGHLSEPGQRSYVGDGMTRLIRIGGALRQ